MNKKGLLKHFPFLGRVLLVLTIIFQLSFTGCTSEVPAGIDFSNPTAASSYIDASGFTEKQKGDLKALLQKNQAVAPGTTASDPVILQKLADLDAQKKLLESQIADGKKQISDLDKKITDTKSDISNQMANNNSLLMSDYGAKITNAQSSFNNQLADLLRQQRILESRLDSQVAKLAELDKLTRDFIIQNKDDMKLLFGNMTKLKASGLLRDDDVNVVKDLQTRIDDMNGLFAKIFNSSKTGSEVLEENRQVLEKLMVKNFARFVTVDVTDPAHPQAFSAGSANLLLKSGSKLVFSTASHVSKEIYLSQRGIGKQKFGLHIAPLQMLSVKAIADRPVTFAYQDSPGATKVLVSDRYQTLVDQEAAFIAEIERCEARILVIYQQVYNLEQTLSFKDVLGMPAPSASIDAEHAYYNMLDLQDAINRYITKNGVSKVDQTIVDNMSPLFTELNDIVDNHINPDFQALAQISQDEISEDTSLVVVDDPNEQLKDLTPLLTLKDGQLVPPTVTINGQPFVVPFTIDNLFGTGVYNVGLTTEIYAGGLPFDSMDSDQQDVNIDYNGSVLDWLLETDIWFERKMISRVHQPKPIGAQSGTRKGIPNYLQVTGSMGSGSSGGLNWTIESYKSKALVFGNQPVLTKEGKVILRGYDDTLRTTDALPVYIGSDSTFTEVLTGTFLRIDSDGKISNGPKKITNDLKWIDLKTMQGIGVNSFGVLDWWTGAVQSSNIANFALTATQLRQRLETAIGITIPNNVYKQNLVVTLAQ